MFFGKKERDLVKQVNDELSERIIGQPIAYYPISLEESNFNETYGEAVEKISLPPVRVFAYVVVENEQTNERYGYDYQTKLTVNFHRRRLVEDQNLYVRVGDFVQYGDEFYEIVRLYNDTRYLFGQVEHKFQVTADCVRAREGVFKVMPGIDRPVTETEAAGEPDAPAPRPAPYPPLTATYITVTPDSKLPNERVLTAGAGISLVDGGSNSTITIAASGQNAAGPTGSIQFQQGGGTFDGNANLVFLSATNTLSITGGLTASTLVSASVLHATTVSASLVNLSPRSGSLAGLGSYLGLDSNNNIILTSSVGTGTGDGIFTLLDGSSAYVTSSLAIGGTSAPDHKVSISGSLSASVNISASAFYGDGSNLSGITTSAAGTSTQIQFNSAGDFAGSANLTFNNVTLTGSYTGSLAELTTVTASAMNLQPLSGTLAGPGSYLGLDTNNNLVLTAGDGATTSPAGATTQIQFNNAGAFGASANLTYNSTTGHLANSGTLSVSASLDDGQIFRVDASPRGAMLYLTGARGVDGAQVTSLGIGTDNPRYALDVRGYITLGQSGGGYILVNDDANTWIRFGHAGSDSMQFRAGGLNFLEFDENGLDIASINPDGVDIDFQVATLNNDYTIFTEGSTDRVGIGTNVPSHTLTTAGNTHLSGGLVHKHATVSSVYTASVADYILGVSAVPTEIEVDATLFAEGQVLVIKDESGAANGTDTILLNAAAAQTIDGAATATIESPYGSVLLYSDGTNWFIY